MCGYCMPNKKSRSKIPERFIFITTPFLTIWLFMRITADMMIENINCATLPVGTCDQSFAYHLGELTAPFVLGFSYLLTGIFLRRDRIKKERLAMI